MHYSILIILCTNIQTDIVFQPDFIYQIPHNFTFNTLVLMNDRPRIDHPGLLPNIYFSFPGT
jgi:hypothetical protein